MEWFTNLLFGSSVAHTILVFAIAIAFGILLGRINFKGISLGVTWILFLAIAMSHFGLRVDPTTLHFVKEFGLILFVYSVGLQVGPGFFSSFKSGGMTLNALATGIVFLGAITAYVIHVVTGTDLVTMVGILYGAVTNTPGLGAAQQTFSDALASGAVGLEYADGVENIALGYAVAYPLGVVGVILTIVMIRYLFGINSAKELAKIQQESSSSENNAQRESIVVNNPSVFGKTIQELHSLIDRSFVVSRLCRRGGTIEIPNSKTVIKEGDRLLLIASPSDMEPVVTFLGTILEMDSKDWEEMESNLTMQKIIITNPHVNGRSLGSLGIRSAYGVNVTRVIRAGIDLVATARLELQLGDRIIAVGQQKDIERLSERVGNSVKQLNTPHLVGIFIGIAVGVIFGSIPFLIPGIPQPVKLGLAGGPLIVAILISRFGFKFGIITYTTQSANLMLREIGISLFLAAVGFSAGEGFVDTIINKGGLVWIGYGFIITMVPMLIVATVARFIFKLNYFTIAGLVSGSLTNPPGLAYSNALADTESAAVAYATIYPLVMFLRVLCAQIMILMAI